MSKDTDDVLDPWGHPYSHNRVRVSAMNLAQWALQPLGVEPVRLTSRRRVPLRLHRLTIPAALSASPAKGGLDLVVRLEDMTSYVGFSFAPDGWHPYVVALEERLANPGLPYRHSFLARFYATYRPTSVQGVLLDQCDRPMPPLSWWPPALTLSRNLWSLKRRHVRGLEQWRDGRTRALRGSLSQQSQWYGPVDDSFGDHQLRRLVDAHESIREHGFRPDVFSPIDGYFVVRGAEFRFVIRSGNHRAAALKVLGYDRVPVRLAVGLHPSTIAYGQLDLWTPARGGLLPREVAEAVFLMQLRESGRDKAARLELT